MNTKGILGIISKIREQANLLIEEELRARKITGVLPAHGSVLHYLFEQKGPVPIKTIVERVGRVKSTVTGIIKTLEHHGYVQKSPCATDNRIVYVELTQKGKSIQNDFNEISLKLIDILYGELPMKNRERLIEFLLQISNNLIQTRK